MGQRRADLIAEIDDIPTFLHFHRKQYARLTIEPRNGVRILVPAFDFGKISDVNWLTRVSGNVDQNLLDLLLGGQQSTGLERDIPAGNQESAGILDDVALLERLYHLRWIRKVLRNTLQAAGNPDLLFLIPRGDVPLKT